MGIRFNDGWRRFKRFFSRRRREDEFRRELRKKIQQQLILLRRDIVGYIDSEKHGIPNSPLTILIKGSSKPLVDRGDLRQSINLRTEITREKVHGGVGVLRTKRSKDGKVLWNLAIALHEGFVIKVTPKVRAAVFAEMRKRRGKKTKFVPTDPGAAGSKNWKVRGRPFVEDPFKAAETRIKVALGDGVQLSLSKE